MILSQTGKNHEDIQQMNRSLVIRLLQQSDCISRAEITKQSGLNQATVTNIVSDFLEWGLVRETGLIAGTRGRRSIAVELAADNYLIVGVRLARKHFSVGVFDLSGKCYNKIVINIDPHEEAQKILTAIQNQVLLLTNDYQDRMILGIGVALPGPFIKTEGQIALLTETTGWQDIDIAEQIAANTHLKVFVEHDANAAALAEWRYTQNYDVSTPIMCIMAGQGVGAGFIDNGRVVNGAIGIAGEIGHMSIRFDGPKCECGNHGCLEKYCSTIAIQKEISARLGSYPDSLCSAASSFPEIVEAYKKGDALATAVVNDAARYLGYGISNLINIINPGKIIIGDELSKTGAGMLAVVLETVKQRVLPKLYEHTEIVLSRLDNAALMGACLLVIEESLQHPEVFILNKGL